jgi:integration host factor subunit beta
MIKSDLVKRIASKFKLSINLTNKVVLTMFDEIINGLVSDSRTELRRFGVFTVKQQKARKITLPSGKEITRPARKIAIFKPSPTIKKKLNQSSKKRF